MSTTAVRIVDTMPWSESTMVPPTLNSPTELKIRKALGHPAAALRTVSWVPWVAEAGVRLGMTRRSILGGQLEGLIALIVSQDNSCRHCYGTTRAMLRVGGLGEKAIRRLEADLHTGPLSEREFAALEYARRVSRAAPRTTPADLAQIQAAGYTPGEAVQMTVSAACTVFNNRVATLLALQAEPIEGIVGGPLGWIARPVLATMMRMHKPSYPMEPVPPGTTTPVDSLFAALEGVDGREELRRTVVDAQASPLTTMRQKALIMAVIGAGLDCHVCTRASRDTLRREGIPEAEVEGMVTHLTGPRLDPFEVKLMHFARETVRYRPEIIHAKCTEFFRGLAPELIVEVVGLCALANLLGRLSVLLPK